MQLKPAGNEISKIDEPLTYKKIELYFAYLMTIPGIPTMYYGDEIGITGAADPDNRRMMKWNDVPKKHATELKIILQN